jgi:hypothetical protein
VNVVKGLKLYESIFTDSELSKLTDFVDELRVAGQNGELSGDLSLLPTSIKCSRVHFFNRMCPKDVR